MTCSNRSYSLVTYDNLSPKNILYSFPPNHSFKISIFPLILTTHSNFLITFSLHVGPTHTQSDSLTLSLSPSRVHSPSHSRSLPQNSRLFLPFSLSLQTHLLLFSSSFSSKTSPPTPYFFFSFHGSHHLTNRERHHLLTIIKRFFPASIHATSHHREPFLRSGELEAATIVATATWYQQTPPLNHHLQDRPRNDIKQRRNQTLSSATFKARSPANRSSTGETNTAIGLTSSCAAKPLKKFSIPTTSPGSRRQPPPTTVFSGETFAGEFAEPELDSSRPPHLVSKAKSLLRALWSSEEGKVAAREETEVKFRTLAMRLEVERGLLKCLVLSLIMAIALDSFGDSPKKMYMLSCIKL